ncbi:MAG: sugar transferase [Agathobacter sp.]
MYRKKRRSWIKHIDFMLLDIICLQIAFIVSYVIRFGIGNPYSDSDYRNLALVFMLIDFFVEIVFDSFKNVLKRGYLVELTATCKHVFLVELVTAFYLFSTQLGGIYSRISYYVMVPIYIVISFTGRIIWKKILVREGLQTSKRSLLVLAPEEQLTECLEVISKSCMGYSKISAAALDVDLKGENIRGIPVVADSSEIVDYACSEWVDEILIPPCRQEEYPQKMVRQFMEMGIAVHSGITRSGELSGSRRQVEKIGDYTVITTSLNYASSMQLLVKRLMDIAGGLAGCVITLLILIIFGPVIYISSPGPIFFAQERVGRNGRKFKMYKFRTMYPDAEERKKELMEHNRVKDGMMFKLDFDPRIIGNKILPDGTKKEGIGSFMRRTSLDEFPQFWNILRGDMSLVGTRPPTLDEWEQYEPHHRARMAFRPGLTGLWQVSGRSQITDFEEVVRLDTRYIDEWSLGLDLRILFKTVRVVLGDDGAM